MGRQRHKLNSELDQFARKLPKWACRFVQWITGPSVKAVRIPLGIVLIVAGIFGFLPILGYWMLPLGLVLLASDVPLLRTPTIRLLDWINRKWPRRRESH